MNLIERNRDTLKNRLVLVLAHIAAIIDGMIYLVTLEEICTYLHAWVLFDLFPSD